MDGIFGSYECESKEISIVKLNLLRDWVAPQGSKLPAFVTENYLKGKIMF